MKVLIVNAFLESFTIKNTGARFKSSFSVFEEHVRAALKDCKCAEILSTNKPLIEIVRVGDLDARVLLCDWETDAIEQKHRRALGHFDSFDLIFVGGDSNHSPFDNRLKNLLTLSKMAYYADKPYISVGVPALVDVYSICGKGRFLDVLGVGKVSALRDIGHLSPQAAYCDVETGDLYCYSVSDKGWEPVLNAGLHVESRSVKTVKVAEKFKRPVEQRTRNTEMEPDSATLFDRDVLVKIDAKLQPHWALQGLHKGNLTFLATGLHHWVVNRTVAPPDIATVQVPLAVLAEGPTSPILLEFGNRLLYCAEVNTGKTHSILRRLVGNFTKHHVARLIHSPTGYICKSIMRFVIEQQHLVRGEGGPSNPVSKGFLPCREGMEVQEVSVARAVNVGPSLTSATASTMLLGKSQTHDPYRWSSSKTIYPPSSRLTLEQRMHQGAFGDEDEDEEEEREDGNGGYH